MDIIKAATDLADHLFDLFGRAANQIESQGRVISRESLQGSIGEITTAIDKGKQGEVSVVLSGCLQHYPARALRADEQFEKGTKVRIADVGANLLYIQPYREGQQTAHIEIVD